MEFWIGLSVGMHLGKVIADYLEKFVDAYGLLDPKTVGKIGDVVAGVEEVGSDLDALAD